MPRIAANRLKVRPLPNGRFLVFGNILGEKIRKRFRGSTAHTDALAFQADKEQTAAEQTKAVLEGPQWRKTRLTDAQVADAEAAVLIGNGRTLVEGMKIANQYAPQVMGVTCEHARDKWLAALGDRKRSVRTEDKNKRRVTTFLRWGKVSLLTDITADKIERYIYRKDAADFTRLTDAQVLRAWLNFCCAPARRWLAITPFQIDMKDLSATARPKAPGRILSPEQCQRLLDASAQYRDGAMLPYCILTTWLFMRDSEAKRTTRDMMKLDAKTPVVVCEPTKRGTVRHRNITVPANVLPALRAAADKWPQFQPAPKRKRKNATPADVPFAVPYSRNMWSTVREMAGLIRRGKTTRGKRRPLIESHWQNDITRHTGISYLYQKTGDIKEVCRQAGNSSAVSFRHYLTLPAEGAADKFYAATPFQGTS